MFLACPGDVWYVAQPPTELNCNPLGQTLLLLCAIEQKNGYGTLTWYWTRCVDNAGIKGTAIQLDDKSDVYGVYQTHTPFEHGNFTLGYLIFLVTSSTLGYYWCELDSASSRPSVITPILQPANESLPDCNINDVIAIQYRQDCAIEGSPINISSRVPLPSFCPDDTPTPNTLTVTITLLALFGALIFLLVMVIVVLSVLLRRRTMRSKRFVKNFCRCKVNL